MNSTPPVVVVTRTEAKGGFTLSNVPDGVYEICAEGDKDYPNSCQWVPVPMRTRATVVAGQAASGIQLRLKKAVAIGVRINDTSNVLQAARADGSTAQVVIGVFNAHGPFIPAYVKSKGPTGSDYEILVPADTPLNLHVSSPNVTLNDPSGSKISASGFTVPVQIPSAASKSAAPSPIPVFVFATSSAK